METKKENGWTKTMKQIVAWGVLILCSILLLACVSDGWLILGVAIVAYFLRKDIKKLLFPPKKDDKEIGDEAKSGAKGKSSVRSKHIAYGKEV